ncbi:hypothetical protein HHL16_02335 [Pseudoflavitalea sp. G-6-1-2]|uniref:hypothetical protein n=1 Tax=Pseudoflavitalea sp. G-6-1-2 TaxID=2728841 RepID=UPI00146CC4AC|nr:hypothetical protein [Pseudoflavitalea sp. G-6-1-2]NML19689.1 hypothetical protein [Pseudoflavitalea sp. G-6-1-2]
MANTINPNADQDPVKLPPGLLVHLNPINLEDNIGKFRPEDLVPGTLSIKVKKIKAVKGRVKFTITFETDNVQIHTTDYEVPKEEMNLRGAIDILPGVGGLPLPEDDEAEYTVSDPDSLEVILDNPDPNNNTLGWQFDFESGGGKVRGAGI